MIISQKPFKENRVQALRTIIDEVCQSKITRHHTLTAIGAGGLAAWAGLSTRGRGVVDARVSHLELRGLGLGLGLMATVSWSRRRLFLSVGNSTSTVSWSWNVDLYLPSGPCHVPMGGSPGAADTVL